LLKPIDLLLSTEDGLEGYSPGAIEAILSVGLSSGISTPFAEL